MAVLTFEYGRLGLPEPDLVLYLDMPTERAVDMLRQREKGHPPLQGDIHEPTAPIWPTLPAGTALEAAERLWLDQISLPGGSGVVAPAD